MRLVIVDGKGKSGVNVGRPVPFKPMGTLLHSCARATRSSQITLGRAC